jgi:hypothetical protein
VGSVIAYGGFNYLVGAGVMFKININPGFSARPVTGKPGFALTRARTTGSAIGAVNAGRRGPAGLTVHHTLRPALPGAVNPGTINRGVVNPGMINSGAIHPGWANRGAIHPGWANRGAIHSGGGRPLTGGGRGRHR